MEKFITNYIKDSVSAKQNMLADSHMVAEIEASAKALIECFKNGGKVLTAGNGGSAADSQHIAAELVSKFLYNRKALNAIALTTNSSILTAVGNDFSHEYVFARQIEAYGNEGDVFIAISTSGNSKNIIMAIEEAKKRGVKVIGLTGNKDCLMDGKCDYHIKVPSDVTSVIQEAHIMVGHILCGLTEKEFI